ncbi:L-seryl-tRNA(Sec) selenium transferase [Desulfurivibrio alkaliphilus]|uniref:L-seryl-tRNA(Sec) selenium transferase n=1 Tax=Desulfurivibrio alkaliphilus (strain DSM 19089 / UNIQEM U267 / AHT2) TaxID=589865 RepID=D6Z644_DESAT|nr:L-seryl-tRNA(Sec) selenium transferase [Desulfurivibrio alkaliphilus]ADH84926.1 L-seryl-tRNA selenium transferase [Desulfurivibrio alkaliphilus AHT 2]
MTRSPSAAADSHSLLRAIPKVDEAVSWLASELEDPGAAESAWAVVPPRLMKNVVREVLAEYRRRILAGDNPSLAELAREGLLPRLKERLAGRLQPNFRPVINATGVVVHTNLGRSLLPAAASANLAAVACRYSNLEYDLHTGRRGSRYSLVEDLLLELTGAEAALVVNNNAAAVLLVLQTLAHGREVIVSRGQLVEIGGSFRIPEVMARSGARLVEVGATNRTHRRDYEQAIGEETALLLKVHTSNYRISGFTSEVAAEELVDLARGYRLPVMEDLGSGSLLDFSRYGLTKEPTVQEVLAAGVDVVTFSGDKLLGGPQAGLILGRRELIEQIKKNPLNRALRIDKFTLAALESVLRLYFDEEQACREIPTLRMLTSPYQEQRRRAQRLRRRLRGLPAACCELELVRVNSRVGGGALPEMPLPSCALALKPQRMSLNRLEQALRAAPVPVIGRIEDDRLLLDMRTVADAEVAELASVVQEVLGT